KEETVSGEFGVAFGEEFAEDGAVAVLFEFAVAADGEVGLVRKGGKEVEKPRSVMVLHFGAEFAFEDVPGLFVIGVLGEGDEFGRGRKSWQPGVVEVAFGELRFPHAARRSAHGADAQAFVRLAGSAETYDADGHDARI